MTQLDNLESVFLSGLRFACCVMCIKLAAQLRDKGSFLRVRRDILECQSTIPGEITVLCLCVDRCILDALRGQETEGFAAENRR